MNLNTFIYIHNSLKIISKAPNASRTLNKTAKTASQFGKTEKSSKKMGRPRKVDPGQPKQNGRPRKLDLITDYTSPTAMRVAQKAKSIQVKSKWWKRGIPVVKVEVSV